MYIKNVIKKVPRENILHISVASDFVEIKSSAAISVC